MISTRIGMCHETSLSNFMKIHSAIKWLKSKQTYRHSETLTLTFLQLSMHMWQKTNTNSRHGFNTEIMEHYNFQLLQYFVHFVPTTFSTRPFWKYVSQTQ